ncbi:hypothetical protein ABEB36_004525, partial [Hypothenemus hampei]
FRQATMSPLTFLALVTLFLAAESTSYVHASCAIQLKKYYVIANYRNFVGAMIGCAKDVIQMARVNSADQQSLLENAILQKSPISTRMTISKI